MCKKAEHEYLVFPLVIFFWKPRLYLFNSIFFQKNSNSIWQINIKFGDTDKTIGTTLHLYVSWSNSHKTAKFKDILAKIRTQKIVEII